MDTDSTPAVAFDTSINIILSAPFADHRRLSIFSRHAGQATMLIYLTAVDAAIGRIDETSGHFSGLSRHIGSAGSTYQSHHDRRPGERHPSTVAGRLSKR